MFRGNTFMGQELSQNCLTYGSGVLDLDKRELMIDHRITNTHDFGNPKAITIDTDADRDWFCVHYEDHTDMYATCWDNPPTADIKYQAIKVPPGFIKVFQPICRDYLCKQGNDLVSYGSNNTKTFPGLFHNCKYLIGVTFFGNAMYIDNMGEYHGSNPKISEVCEHMLIVDQVFVTIYDPWNNMAHTCQNEFAYEEIIRMKPTQIVVHPGVCLIYCDDKRYCFDTWLREITDPELDVIPVMPSRTKSAKI